MRVFLGHEDASGPEADALLERIRTDQLERKAAVKELLEFMQSEDIKIVYAASLYLSMLSLPETAEPILVFIKRRYSADCFERVLLHDSSRDCVASKRNYREGAILVNLLTALARMGSKEGIRMAAEASGMTKGATRKCLLQALGLDPSSPPENLS